jgi:cell division protease FtsH
MTLPTEDRYTQTRSELIDMLAYALGGRAAEELVFHEPTTGASNDIEKASAIARTMVTQYGMSARLGAIKFGTSNNEPFLGRDMGHTRDYSEDVAHIIDDEVRALIESAHDEAWDILVEHRDALDDLVLGLMEKETLNKEEVARILAPVKKRNPHNVYLVGGKRQVGKRKPPVLTPAEIELLGKDAPSGTRNGSRAKTETGKANGSSRNGSTGAKAASTRRTSAADGPKRRTTTRRTSRDS